MKARLETIASIILLLMVVLLVIWWFIALARAVPWIDEIQFRSIYGGRMASLMSEEIKVIPIDLSNGKYVIEIPPDSGVDFHDVAMNLDEWIENDYAFMILCKGVKLTRVDADDIQEKT